MHVNGVDFRFWFDFEFRNYFAHHLNVLGIELMVNNLWVPKQAQQWSADRKLGDSGHFLFAEFFG